MNREAIRKTAVCRYQPKEKLYIVESPLLDILHGIAETKKKAWDIFDDLLDGMYIKYLEGKTVGLYQKPGRPAKGRIDFHAQIKPKTKKTIDKLARNFGISKGEAIDYLALLHTADSAHLA
jgi:hypothetical protein